MTKRESDWLWIGAIVVGGWVARTWFRQHKVVSTAMEYLGVPYSLGGSSMSGIDCSGLVMKAYQSIGIELPHKSTKQLHLGTEVPISSLAPGDITYWDSHGTSVYDHVGIYIGNGEIINATSYWGKTAIDKVTDWQKRKWLSGARRLI